MAGLRPADEPVTVRPGRAEDVAPLTRLWCQGWHDAHDGHVPAELAALRTDASFARRAGSLWPRALVASRGGRPIGFALVVDDELEQLYVDRAARGSGAADLLIAAAEEQVAAAGHRTAWLAVVPGNERARRFYRRRGWQERQPFDHRVTDAGVTVVVPVLRMERNVRPHDRVQSPAPQRREEPR